MEGVPEAPINDRKCERKGDHDDCRTCHKEENSSKHVWKPGLDHSQLERGRYRKPSEKG